MIELGDFSVPPPGPGEVLVEVAAAGLNRAALLSRRATIRGSVLRSRSRQEKGRVIAAFRDAMLPGFASGRLCPVVAEVLPIAEVREAHRLMAKGGLVGKIVLTF